MRTRLLTTLEALEPWREAWDNLVARASSGSPFLSFDWVSAWWTHFRGTRQLRVLLAEDADGLAGLAPLTLARYRLGGLPARVVEFVGAPLRGRRLATCMDFAIARSPEICRAAFSRALQELSPEWDLCALNGVPVAGHNSPLGAELNCLQTAASEVPCLEVQGQDWEQYLAGRGRSFRYWLRRTARRAQSAGLGPVTRVTSAAELEATLPALSRVCGASWKAAGDRGLFSDSGATAQFLSDYLRRTSDWGKVLLTTLAQADQVVAYHLSFLHAEKLWFYDTAYDQDWEQAAPGFQLFVDMIRTGFDMGVTHIDLGPGLHPYKLRWAEAREARANWLGFHRGWRSRLLARGAQVALSLRRPHRRQS